MNRQMRRAYEFAIQSQADTFKHGAIVLKKGKFICGAANLYKTHSLGSGFHRSCHAEVRAICKCRAILNRNDLSDCVMYVLRINKRGEIRLSKPCDDCMSLIEKHGLKVIWSTGNERIDSAAY